MSALLQFYWAVAVPAAVILLGVAVYLLATLDNPGVVYHPPVYPAPDEPVRRFPRELDRKPAVGRAPLQILPPAPAGMDAGSPMYARLTAQLGGEPRYVLTAREWLVELGEHARMELAR